jgi:hypothetical protein
LLNLKQSSVANPIKTQENVAWENLVIQVSLTILLPSFMANRTYRGLWQPAPDYAHMQTLGIYLLLSTMSLSPAKTLRKRQKKIYIKFTRATGLLIGQGYNP